MPDINVALRGLCVPEHSREELYDVEAHQRSNDILSTKGFLKLIQLVLKTRADGLIHCGPPCSTWVWVNRATSKRSRDSPAGDASVPSVASSNLITCRLVLVLMLAACRYLYTLVEQPRSSLMPWFQLFVKLSQLLANLFGLAWRQTSMSMGSWGGYSPKPSLLFGTAPWSGGLYRKLTKAQREKLRKRLQKKGLSLVKVYRDQRGRKRVQGTKALKSSQVYPRGYGKEVARLHLSYVAKNKGALREYVAKRFPKEPSQKELLKLFRQAPSIDSEQWQCGDLAQIRDFLREQRDLGNYLPTIPIGLD
eukprot:s332_g6.t1